jgi:glucose-6-phosphate isomerase
MKRSFFGIFRSFVSHTTLRRDVPELKYVVHCGIGGSELGATMLVQAVGRKDLVYFPITSLNNDHIAEILATIEPEKTVVIKATRSNKTKEKGRRSAL